MTATEKFEIAKFARHSSLDDVIRVCNGLIKRYKKEAEYGRAAAVSEIRAGVTLLYESGCGPAAGLLDMDDFGD